MTGTLDHEIDLVRSFDGTLIAARRVGRPAGSTVLVCNAIGASLAAWRRTLLLLVADYDVITWDHRGLHESFPPQEDLLGPHAQVRDALSVLSYYGVESVALVSWSTGTRVALEIASLEPDRVECLAVVCGAFGYPLGRVARNFELAPLLPRAAGIAKHFAPAVGRALTSFARRPELAGLIRQSGFVGPTIDTAAFVDLIRDAAACDARVLLASFRAVAGDSFEGFEADPLPPALVIGGEDDQFVPPALLRATAAALSGPAILYERATHYLPLEYPARLAADLNRFVGAPA